MPHTPYLPSYYAMSANPAPPCPELQDEVETDVRMIDAGYTGLSTALFSLEDGFKVTVLEATKVDFSASEHNGGQIVNSYSRDIDVIERTVDKREAQLLDEMAFEGGRIVHERVTRCGIQYDLKNGGVFAALTEKQMGHLRAQKQLWKRYGHSQLEIMDAKHIREVVATNNCIDGMLDISGGHIQPLNLALGEAAAVKSLGDKICEQSPVTHIERGASPMVHTPQGKVRVKFIVVTGSACLSGLVPELAAKSMPCGIQVITTEPPNEKLAHSLLPQDYCMEDCNCLLNYYHFSSDKRLIYSDDVIYGARDPADIEAIIRSKMLRTSPQLKDMKIDFAQTGNSLLTLSRLPQVGHIGDSIYYSQGCNGHGVTYAHIAGKVLAEALHGQTERFDAFTGLPHCPFLGGKLLHVPFTAIDAWYYSLCDKLGV